MSLRNRRSLLLRQSAGDAKVARACLLAIILLLPAPAWGRTVTVTLESTPHGCHVLGAFQAPVATAVAWDVLADYDHISQFVHSMRSSRIEWREDGQLRVRQEVVGSAFLVRHKAEVLLEIHEEAGHRIRFRDVLGKDFSSYAGEWRIAADSSGTHIEYELEAEPRGATARAFSRLVMRSSVGDLLGQVRAEMLRRAAGTGATE